MITGSDQTISSAERAKRKAAIDFARGSVRFEGIILSPEVEEINQQYVDGHIDFETHLKLAHAAVDRAFPAVF